MEEFLLFIYISIISIIIADDDLQQSIFRILERQLFKYILK